MSGLRVGSMFSGVEGMGLGVLDAFPDAEIVWHCEVDPHASTILERHFDAPNLGDVRAVDWSKVEPVDVLIGGPPCQAISQAGARRGMADERWMWPEAFRAMAELRPAWCLWENPMGLLTGRQKDEDDDTDGAVGLDVEEVDRSSVDAGWFGHVLGEMAAVGFVGRWGCLRSSDAGAPHARARVFIAATDPARPGTGCVDRGLPRPVGGTRRSDIGVRATVDGRAAVADADGERLAREPERHGQQVRPGLGSACRHDSLRCGVVAPVDNVCLFPGGRCVYDECHTADRCLAVPAPLLPTPRTSDRTGPGVHGDGGLDLRSAVALLPTPAARDADRGGSRLTAEHRVEKGQQVNLEDAVHLLPDTAWVAVLPDGRTIDYGPAVRRWEQVYGEPAPTARDERGRLNPELPRWMMGYPSGWLDGIPRTAALKAAGNGCQPQVASLGASLLLPELAS